MQLGDKKLVVQLASLGAKNQMFGVSSFSSNFFVRENR